MPEEVSHNENATWLHDVEEEFRKTEVLEDIQITLDKGYLIWINENSQLEDSCARLCPRVFKGFGLRK